MGIGRKENPVNKEPEENQRLPGEQLQLASQRTEPGGAGAGGLCENKSLPGTGRAPVPQRAPCRRRHTRLSPGI